ncbi:hypothetical protein QOT17_025402 [Balamuthia mandrillaris]
MTLLQPFRKDMKKSRPADNKTVTLKRKQKAQPAEVVPLRYWNKSITAVWQSFRKVFPETDISLKTFRKYAPPQIKRCKRRTAVCSKCLNGAKYEQQLKPLLRKMEASTEEGRQLQALLKEEEEFTSLPRSCLLGLCAHDLHQNPSTTASISSSSISSSLIAPSLSWKQLPLSAPPSGKSKTKKTNDEEKAQSRRRSRRAASRMKGERKKRTEQKKEPFFFGNEPPSLS